QQRERSLDGGPHRRLRPGGRNPRAVAEDRLSGRTPSAPARPDQRAGRKVAGMATEARIPPWRTLAETDPEIAGAIRDDLHRQDTGLELIASENFVSRAVMEAAGSVMTNKYAEGYPGKRYYGGCEFVDVAELAAISRAKKLFGADHANVQPHS